MRSIRETLARELKLVFRDNIALFLVLAPALLALVYLMVFGSVRAASIVLAVDKDLPQDWKSKLERVADLETLEDLESLKRRVAGPDSVAGVTEQDGVLRLLVEGNESKDFAESMQRLVSAALAGDTVAYESESVGDQDTLAVRLVRACILLLALFVGGATMGLSGVYERESGVIRAVSVSPMTLWNYTVSKVFPALLFGLVGVSACALILGCAEALPRLLLLALCSSLVSGMIIFLVAAFAGNQIAAVGVLKLVMPLFLVVGISSVFVPESGRVFYYALPMFWQYEAIDATLAGKDAMFKLLMVLATSLPWFAVLMRIFAKKTNMKAWG